MTTQQIETEPTMPAIVTASWYTPLPAELCRVGISRGVPRGQSGYRRYFALNPGPWFNSVSETEYIERYAQILSALNPLAVRSDLLSISGGRPVALLCYERVGERWCHRSLVSLWLYRELGVEVHEYGYAGFGHNHPLLPPSLNGAAST